MQLKDMWNYDNHQITAVDMYKEKLDGKDLISYSLIKEEQIRLQNWLIKDNNITIYMSQSV